MMGTYFSGEAIRRCKFPEVNNPYQQWWNDALDSILENAPHADVIPVDWIKTWASKNDVHDERAIAKMLRDWGNENGGAV